MKMKVEKLNFCVGSEVKETFPQNMTPTSSFKKVESSTCKRYLTQMNICFI